MPDMKRIGRQLGPDTNPAGVIYGVLAVGTLIAAEGTRRETYESVIGASGLAIVLYWLAHAYSRHFGERLEQQKQWGPRDVATSLLREAALLKGATLPIVALFIVWTTGAELSTGVSIALWTAAVELFALEVVAGVRRRLPRGELVIEVMMGAMLGAGILGVRVLLR